MYFRESTALQNSCKQNGRLDAFSFAVQDETCADLFSREWGNYCTISICQGYWRHSTGATNHYQQLDFLVFVVTVIASLHCCNFPIATADGETVKEMVVRSHNKVLGGVRTTSVPLELQTFVVQRQESKGRSVEENRGGYVRLGLWI
jgi:hypothetical protein